MVDGKKLHGVDIYYVMVEVMGQNVMNLGPNVSGRISTEFDISGAII